MISKSKRFSILARDGFRCQYCGKPASETELHIDHLLPRCQGGDNAYSNLITCCVDCNLGKGRNTLDEAVQNLYKNRRIKEAMLRVVDAMEDYSMSVTQDMMDIIREHGIGIELNEKEAR